MRLYVYNQDTMTAVAIIEGETNQLCESAASTYGDDYSWTYSPALGTVDGLHVSDDAEYILAAQVRGL